MSGGASTGTWWRREGAAVVRWAIGGFCGATVAVFLAWLAIDRGQALDASRLALLEAQSRNHAAVFGHKELRAVVSAQGHTLAVIEGRLDVLRRVDDRLNEIIERLNRIEGRMEEQRRQSRGK